MYRAVRFLFFGFYAYFRKSKSNKIIAYESAIMAFSLFLFMNAMSVLAFFGIKDLSLIPTSDSYWIRWLKMAVIVFLPLFGVLWVLFPKKTITKLEFGDEMVQTSEVCMVLYSVLSFILMIVAAKWG